MLEPERYFSTSSMVGDEISFRRTADNDLTAIYDVSIQELRYSAAEQFNEPLAVDAATASAAHILELVEEREAAIAETVTEDFTGYSRRMLNDLSRLSLVEGTVIGATGAGVSGLYLEGNYAWGTLMLVGGLIVGGTTESHRRNTLSHMIANVRNRVGDESSIVRSATRLAVLRAFKNMLPDED